jgi:sialate O-acetylesterase
MTKRVRMPAAIASLVVGMWTIGAQAATPLAQSSTVAAAAAPAPLLGPLFTDHAVLQRDRPLSLWGEAAPGAEVVVNLGSARGAARADVQGRWRLSLPAQPAGGPHVLVARSGAREQTVRDVRIGDVWLCAGQSNMVWNVRASLNSRAEIAASANDAIRQVTIPMASSTSTRWGFEKPLEWKVAGPQTTGDFSATCYFFAREIAKSQPVAQGLIVSAWGGSKIQPWMSESALRGLGGYDTALDVLDDYRGDPAVAAQRWGEVWQRWWLGQKDVTRGRQPWIAVKGDAADWKAAPPEMTPWESWGVPALATYDGMVWYRARVRLTAAQAKLPATLSLGQVDEVDLTWLNGRAIGSHGCCPERNYAVPQGLLKAGENLVVVNALDTYASGGLYGPAEKRALVFADGTRVPITGWEYQIAPPGLDAPLRSPWEATAGVSMIYNAMIAPLHDYTLRGVAWYQGESNTSVPEGRQYQAQLTALMADWRRQFAAPLPFLVVQLANYGPMAREPVESGWALTREAQRRAVVADGNAGLAVTIDIGNRDDVHPTNKQDVGRRLARAARHVVFGEKLSPSGAMPVSAQREGSAVVVHFANADGDLLVMNSRDPAAFELCGPTEGSCRFVSARLRGPARVTLDASEMAAPTRVRFCWADSPLCNLFDAAGLPVGPFEIGVN